MKMRQFLGEAVQGSRNSCSDLLWPPLVGCFWSISLASAVTTQCQAHVRDLIGDSSLSLPRLQADGASLEKSCAPAPLRQRVLETAEHCWGGRAAHLGESCVHVKASKQPSFYFSFTVRQALC